MPQKKKNPVRRERARLHKAVLRVKCSMKPVFLSVEGLELVILPQHSLRALVAQLELYESGKCATISL
jgi:hypothetical protein